MPVTEAEDNEKGVLKVWHPTVALLKKWLLTICTSFPDSLIG